MRGDDKTRLPHEAAATLIAADTKKRAKPIWLLPGDRDAASIAGLEPAQRSWIAASGPKAYLRRALAVPAADGAIAGYAFDANSANARDPLGRAELAIGLLPQQLPPGLYALEGGLADAELAAVAWGLGAYRYRRHKTGDADPIAHLKLAKGVAAARVGAIVEAVARGRDLINAPASELGPAELEAAVRAVAARFGADVSSIVGDALLAKNFPMIHAVGRASPQPPRLIDLTWKKSGGRPDAPKLTLVGKGVCFDTGGLDLKPSSGMLLMKKDMGRAASALAVAEMIMALGLDVRLRLLIPAVENSVAGNAFRPGDVLKSRSGRTVEIGNTDAEGRLVLADALTLADEEQPDTMLTFATLTGAARVALGPDLPALFSTDDALAAGLAAAGDRVGDPLWRLPFWEPYEVNLDSPVADMNNVSEGPFAGAVTAALFLRRFVRQTRRYAHIDMFGWRPAARPLGPRGGEAQVARAVLAWLETELAAS